MDEKTVPMKKYQMRTPSQSLQRLMQLSKDAEKELANAIICVAADDYRLAKRTGDNALKEEVEAFFRSDWFRALTDADPDYILSRLKKEKVPRS